MIHRLIDWSLSHRALIILIYSGLAIWGLVALNRTSIDAIPDLSDVQVIIKTSYPGQAPQVVEDQVTYPLTTAMLSVPGSTIVRGYSFFGDSYVYVIFEDGTDLYWARSRVLEYLNQVSAQLPQDAHPVLGPDATGVGWIYQYALIDRTGTHDLAELRALQDWFLKFELQTIPGVSEVATIGGMVRQYQVVVDPNRLRGLNIPLEKVKMAIIKANQEVGGSVIEMAEAEYMVRAKGYLSGLEDLADIPIDVSESGTPVLLADIAELRLGPEMRRGVSELDGQGEAVGGIIILRSGGNARAAIDLIKAKLESLKPGLPEGVEIVTTYDRSKLIDRAVDNLKSKLFEEIIAVMLICTLFLLHLRSSLVIIISLPLGILMAFGVMNAQGLNANIMSLGGIAIAIGAMVDAAIVMVESYHRQLEEHQEQDRWKLVSDTVKQVGPALFFSLLIITVSFLPVFALEAQEGRMFKPLAFTKTYSMAAAALISVTLVPVLMGYFIKGKLQPEERNPINRALKKFYQPLIKRTLKRPRLTLVLGLLLALSALIPLNRLGSEFMPDLNEGDLIYMPSFHPGISIGKASQILQQMDRLIISHPEVLSVHGKLGRADTATDPAPLTMIETLVQLKPKTEWRRGITIEDIRQELDARIDFPGVTNAWVMPIKTRIDMLATGIKTPVGIKVAGPDLETIGVITRQIEDILPVVEGTKSVFAERVVGGRFIDVDIDRKKASRYGLNIALVQDVIRTAIGGMRVSETIEGRERFPINLRYPYDSRSDITAIQNLPIITPNGAHIALSDVATIAITDGPALIRSENAQLNGWVYVDIEGRDLGSYVKDAKALLLSELELPERYTLSWSGQFEYLARATERLKIIVPVTLALILMLLFITFGRLREVLLIAITLPIALTGGLWFIYVLGYNLSVAVMVGFIALAGVAVETAVIMLLYLNQSLERHREQETEQTAFIAIEEGALLRIRPLIMTVAAIIIGLLPIMLIDGTGSEVMQRIAAPMVGGMVTAIILTLFIVPAAYLEIEKWLLNQERLR
jgi:Cu(I)/Ag(I) efflux system membrane protein CusA/SilA